MEKCFEKKNNILIPRQPLMVMATSHYYKVEIKEFGISHFYTFKVSPEMLQKVQLVPDCAVDIMFQCGVENPEAYCYGSLLSVQDTSYTNMLKVGNTVFGLRFLPGKAILPGGFPVSSLTAGSINLASILKDKSLINRISRCIDFSKQIEMFLSAYLLDYEKHQMNSRKFEISNFIVDEIVNSRGDVKVEDISARMGYSTRYINKIFHEALGMSPKMFIKIIRFQGVLSEIRNNTKMTDVAADMGFVDQSHLGKEFKLFTGTTPKKYSEVLNGESFKKRLIILPD